MTSKLRYGWRWLVLGGLVLGRMDPAFAAGEPDLSTERAQALRQELVTGREKLDKERAVAQSELLARQVQTAREQLARAKVSGNVTQQAVARTALQLFEKATERLTKDGVFELPAEARREVQPLLDTARKTNVGIEAVHSSALTALRSELAHKLRALLIEQGTPVESDAAAEGLLPQLESTQAPAAAAAAPSGNSTNAPAATGTSPPEGPKDPEELGANGGATDWEPLLTVGVQVGGLEVVSIPVVGIASERSYQEPGMEAGSEIHVRIVPRQVLLRGEGAVLFRAMSLPGKPKPDVMAWPSARNDWKLELRCRPQGGSPVALRLDVSKASAELKPAAGVAGEADVPRAADEPKVMVKVVTRPEGAGVWINGRGQLQGRQPLVTPCDVAIPASGAEVILRKRGHLDAQVGRVVPTEGQVIQAALTPDPDFVDRTLRIQALVGGGHSGVTLKQGQRVRLAAEGQWACGSRGELVGSEGYAIGKFPHYYTNPALTPRVTTEAAYGALLVRVGAKGPWKAVGNGLTLAAAESGPLQFDINEAPERNMRRDNKGALQVRVLSVP